MKIAILSDIHSNPEALDATFEDLQNENVDAIEKIQTAGIPLENG